MIQIEKTLGLIRNGSINKLTIGFLSFMDVPMHTDAIIVISKAFAVLDLGFGKTKLIVTN